MGHALSQQERLSSALGIRKSRTRPSSTRVLLRARAKVYLVEEPRRALEPEAQQASHRRKDVRKLDLSRDRKSTRLNSSHGYISYAVFCLKKKKKLTTIERILSSSIKLTHHLYTHTQT